MKIRCIDNSIRLRVRKSDVAELNQSGLVSVAVEFPGGSTFTYALQCFERDLPNAECIDGKLSIQVPELWIKTWLNTEEVSLSFELPLMSGDKLKILLEKDFPCKHSHKDYEDTFYELQPEEDRMNISAK